MAKRSYNARHLWPTAVAALLLATCTDRQHRNPLDPETDQPAFEVSGLEVIAGDERVQLRWDFSRFVDITGVRLHREVTSSLTGDGTGALARDLPPSAAEYVDDDLVNGTTYRYHLGIVVKGEGERQREQVRFATPGPESGWIADTGNRVVWKLSPDGRSAFFAAGPFGDIRAIAVDESIGDCWVSDAAFGGLIRIEADGALELFAADVDGAADLSLAATGELGWIIDAKQRRVYWFEVPAAGVDSLRLVEVDASFVEPHSLAATNKRCWIADRGAGSVILYASDGTRSGQWGNLETPGPVAAGAPAAEPDSSTGGWVLVRDGSALVHLVPGSAAVEFALPFGPGIGLDVDTLTGECWVLVENGFATFDGMGEIRRRLDFPTLSDLAVDGFNRQVWLTGSGASWKLSIDDGTKTQLTGFATPVQVEVDPGVSL